ncbi:hypothetical protein E2C01_048197 [Portunus trituberculatus]|uniref:Uncharacterized protein n=1 Tax=Portunus trituberculatus TaxID=210409 RepID=A0A5B7G9Y9_PORTR|nr:hypothetical protein [Portunus trituberculatus]
MPPHFWPAWLPQPGNLGKPRLLITPSSVRPVHYTMHVTIPLLGRSVRKLLCGAPVDLLLHYSALERPLTLHRQTPPVTFVTDSESSAPLVLYLLLSVILNLNAGEARRPFASQSLTHPKPSKTLV